jgi:hypothetical protein
MKPPDIVCTYASVSIFRKVELVLVVVLGEILRVDVREYVLFRI